MTPERSDVSKARKFQAPNTKFQSAYPTNLPRLVPSPSSFTHLLLLDVGRYFQLKDVIFLDSMHTLELGPARNHQVIRVPYLATSRETWHSPSPLSSTNRCLHPQGPAIGQGRARWGRFGLYGHVDSTWPDVCGALSSDDAGGTGYKMLVEVRRHGSVSHSSSASSFATV